MRVSFGVVANLTKKTPRHGVLKPLHAPNRATRTTINAGLLEAHSAPRQTRGPLPINFYDHSVGFAHDICHRISNSAMRKTFLDQSGCVCTHPCTDSTMDTGYVPLFFPSFRSSRTPVHQTVFSDNRIAQLL